MTPEEKARLEQNAERATRLNREMWRLAHADEAYDPADILLFARMAEDMELVAESARAALGEEPR